MCTFKKCGCKTAQGGCGSIATLGSVEKCFVHCHHETSTICGGVLLYVGGRWVDEQSQTAFCAVLTMEHDHGARTAEDVVVSRNGFNGQQQYVAPLPKPNLPCRGQHFGW